MVGRYTNQVHDLQFSLKDALWDSAEINGRISLLLLHTGCLIPYLKHSQLDADCHLQLVDDSLVCSVMLRSCILLKSINQCLWNVQGDRVLTTDIRAIIANIELTPGEGESVG